MSNPIYSNKTVSDFIDLYNIFYKYLYVSYFNSQVANIFLKQYENMMILI